MSTLADLVTVGYTVDEGGGLAAISGLGVATTIEVSDQAAIDSLYNVAVNPDPAPAPGPAGPTVQEKVAAALQTIQADNGTNPVTADQLATVIQALTS